MTDPFQPLRRGDLHQALNRDFQRLRRKARAQGTFWRSLGVIGSVGWPIVLLAAGGAMLGHWLDVRWGSGIRWALILVLCGAATGGWVAWHALKGTEQ